MRANSDGGNYTTTVGLMAGTSPSIAALPGGGYPGVNGVITASNEFAMETWSGQKAAAREPATSVLTADMADPGSSETEKEIA
jgi:hypothetical protein